jgi:FhaA, N-terminal domain/FHA domain
MDALSRFENLIEGIVEGSLAEITTGHLHPIEIAKKLARAMDSGQTIGAGGPLAPNSYTVEVNAADYAVFSPFSQSLERELASYLRALATERGFSFVARPQVTIVENGSLRPRRIRIGASLSDGAASEALAAQTQMTAPLPVSQVRERLARSAALSLTDGRRVALDKPVTSLGRQIDNDIVIEDRRVSRHHAQIRYEHSNFCLYDLASANGTSVNSQAIGQIILRDGDTVSLGGVEMTFHRRTREGKRGA